MSKKIKYTKAPKDIADSLDRSIRVKDFLPSPDQLVMKEEKEKITIALNKESLDAYRKYAKDHNVKYQTMINRVVSAYADEHLAKK